MKGFVYLSIKYLLFKFNEINESIFANSANSDRSHQLSTKGQKGHSHLCSVTRFQYGLLFLQTNKLNKNKRTLLKKKYNTPSISP